MNMNKASVYHCVECGKLSQCLFRRFNAGIIKVSFCVRIYILLATVLLITNSELHFRQSVLLDELILLFAALLNDILFQTECGQIIDKYTLCDPVVMLLDALLHKPQVYRHLLYNTNIPVSRHTFIMLVFCECSITFLS